MTFSDRFHPLRKNREGARPLIVKFFEQMNGRCGLCRTGKSRKPLQRLKNSLEASPRKRPVAAVFNRQALVWRSDFLEFVPFVPFVAIPA
jgi:hypothetical protein